LGLAGLWVVVLGLAVGCEPTHNSTGTESNASTSPGASAQPATPDEGSAVPASAAHNDQYSLKSPAAPVVVGQKHRVELAVTPGDGLKINKEFPWKLEFSTPEGVQIAQKQVSGAQIDLADSQATIPLHLEAAVAGKHRLDATGDFSVCNDTKCYVIRDQPLSFKLAADLPPADEPADESKADEPKE
jgi:hypothetical protein